MVFSSLLQYTPITEGTLLKLYQTALPDYVSAFLISITDEVYNRSVGIISITAIVAIWSAAKGIQYMTDGLNSVNELVCAKTLGNRLYDRVFVCSCIYTCSIGIRKYAA
jgi:membrane protein